MLNDAARTGNSKSTTLADNSNGYIPNSRLEGSLAPDLNSNFLSDKSEVGIAPASSCQAIGAPA